MSGLKAVVAQAAASATILLLTIVIARSGGTAALGQFGIAMALLLLAQAVAREATIMTLVSASPTSAEIRQRSGRQSIIGIVASLTMIGGGWASGSWMMVVVGIGAQGMLLAHYTRLVSLTLWRGRLAMLQELLVLGCALVPAAGSVLYGWPGSYTLMVWVVSYALVGYAAAFALRLDIVPRWRGTGREGRVGGLFAAQSLVSTGSVHLLTLALAGFVGPILVGALRGAGTVIAPANMILTALYPLAVARLGPLRQGSAHELRLRLVSLTGGAVAVFLSVAGAMALIVHLYGEVLLGGAWVDVQPILWIVVIDGVIAAMYFVPAAAHRALWEHKRSSAISVLAAIARFLFVLGGALVAGVIGAAAGYLAANALLCIAWWASAAKLTGGRAS